MAEAVRENGTLGLNWVVSLWIPAFAGMTNFDLVKLTLNHQPVPGRELVRQQSANRIRDNRGLFDR
jgi:hypothetical protein